MARTKQPLPTGGKRVRSDRTPPIQSLDRGLIIMEAVAKSKDPVSLGVLSNLIGIDHSSAFRLANTLKRRGLLSCPNGRKDYVLGPAIWQMARRYDWSRTLVMVCHPHVIRLAEVTGETSHLAIREGQRALFIDHEASSHMVGVAGRTGEVVPLHCTAHGKALLTDYTLPQLRALFGDGPLDRYTKKSIVSIEGLARACAAMRARGYASDDAEMVDGIRCLAAPIRADDGAIVASIGISAPAIRFVKERSEAWIREVTGVAKSISEDISRQG